MPEELLRRYVQRKGEEQVTHGNMRFSGSGTRESKEPRDRRERAEGLEK